MLKINLERKIDEQSTGLYLLRFDSPNYTKFCLSKQNILILRVENNRLTVIGITYRMRKL